MQCIVGRGQTQLDVWIAQLALEKRLFLADAVACIRSHPLERCLRFWDKGADSGVQLDFPPRDLPALIENPLGSGLGLSTVGARHFVSIDQMQIVESYFGILAIETGVPGLLAGLFVIVTIMITVYRLWRRLGKSPAAIVWYGLAAYVLVTIAVLPVSTALDHSPTNLYFWFTVGVLAKLPDLARKRPLSAFASLRGTAGRNRYAHTVRDARAE